MSFDLHSLENRKAGHEDVFGSLESPRNGGLEFSWIECLNSWERGQLVPALWPLGFV